MQSWVSESLIYLVPPRVSKMVNFVCVYIAYSNHARRIQVV
jgi:hypothetical protein